VGHRNIIVAAMEFLDHSESMRKQHQLSTKQVAEIAAYVIADAGLTPRELIPAVSLMELIDVELGRPGPNFPGLFLSALSYVDDVYESLELHPKKGSPT
jgi:hypothetical protein